ncbi:MAG: hypothetical protein AAF846_21925 [Chloroflexota bacterium]
MIILTIATPADFDFRRTVLSHGWYQLAPNTYDDTTQTLKRPFLLDSGKTVHLSIEDGKSNLLTITVYDVAIISSRDRNNILRGIERMFSLKQRLTKFYETMSKTEGYEWVAEHRTARLLASPTIWEDLVKTLLTTNTSWSNTQKMVAQICSLDAQGIFPSPADIVALMPDDFADKAGIGYRAPYLYEASQRIASGEIDLKQWQTLDSDSLYKAITDLTGFGDYAAGTLMRLMGHFDKLAIDTVARKAYEHVTGHAPDSDTDIRRYYDDFGKWRGLVLWMDCIRDDVDIAPQPIAE